MLVVLRHADIMQIDGNTVSRNYSVKIIRAGQIAPSLRIEPAIASKRACDLAHAIGAKIKTYTRVVIANRSHGLAATIRTNKWHDEFIGDIFVIRIRHALNRISVLSAFANSVDHRL